MCSKINDDLNAYYALDAKRRNEHTPQEWKLGLRESFLRMIQVEGKSSLLEIGAGTGKDSRFFADRGLTVTAVDLSAEMVKLCRRKGIDAYEMDISNVSQLNLKFDAIWSMNSLLHVEKAELPSVLEKLDCVLRPGGLFYFGVYGGQNKEEMKTETKIPIPRYFCLYSDNTLKNLVKKCFDIVSFETVSP